LKGANFLLMLEMGKKSGVFWFWYDSCRIQRANAGGAISIAIAIMPTSPQEEEIDVKV
jgi:hypothetical protein